MSNLYSRIGVIGAGTMGIGLAVNLILYGKGVVLVDVSAEALERACSEVLRLVKFVPLINRSLPGLTTEKATEKLVLATTLEKVSGCDFIIENVTEDVSIKEDVYRKLDALCPPEVCFGVDTSCISITRLAGVTRRPEQVIGMHFMNPAYLTGAVEVIRGYHTSNQSIQAACVLLQQIGKEAIIVNDYPGFVSNRISHLFMNEAAFVVQDQVATPKEVDEIFKKCYGHKMGPLETADLIGLDTVAHSLDVLYQSYQDTKFRCCPLLRKMVDAGLLGVKTKKGFYDYGK